MFIQNVNKVTDGLPKEELNLLQYGTVPYVVVVVPRAIDTTATATAAAAADDDDDDDAVFLIEKEVDLAIQRLIHVTFSIV